MNIQIVGRHMDLGSTLQDQCREALEGLFQKFALTPIHCAVSFAKKEHHQFDTHLLIKLKGFSLRSQGSADTPHGCFEVALTRAREKIARYKKHVEDHHKHRDNHHYKKISALDALLAPDWADVPVEQEPQILEESLEDMAVLGVKEAAARLELSEAGALVFRNVATGRTNVVYRRNGSQIGLIDLKAY